MSFAARMQTVVITGAMCFGVVAAAPAQAAPTIKSTYSGVGYVFVCHGQELQATGGMLSSVYNSTQSGNLLKEVTNVSTSPSLTLLGEDGAKYSIVGKSNAVVETVDYGTYSVASGKYSYDFTLYTASGAVYGTMKGKSAILPNQDVEPLTGSCTV